MATGTQLAFSVAWEQPVATAASAASDSATAPRGASSGFDTPIPPSVSAIRFIYTAPSSSPCCIAVIRGSQAFNDRHLVLADVVPGSSKLEVDGYPADFAPADGVSATCATRPAGQGVACSSRTTLPSYASDEIPVNVVAGQVNVVNVDVHSLPFLIDLHPAEGELIDQSLHIGFAVVDAAHEISPAVEVHVEDQGTIVNAHIDGTTPCADNSPDEGVPDCSDGGTLDVHGRLVGSHVEPRFLPEGTASLRIRASNTADPVREMESNTTFQVPPLVPITGTSSTSSTTVTTPPTTTSTIPGQPETFCLQFSVSSAVDLVGISYNAGYAATGGEFTGSGENVACVSLLDGDPQSTLTSFNDDEGATTLSTAIISAQTFSGPIALARCEFTQVPPLNLASFAIQVTEATAPDLSPANATVVVEETQCPL